MKKPKPKAKQSGYIPRESLMNSYRVTPELCDVLGIKIQEDKNSSTRQINIDFDFLKEYSRKSVMLQSFTNATPKDFSVNKRKSQGDELQLESSKLALVLKRIRNNQ
mmetsp:Transcript_8251/g.9354  ORF Transcript_8251/g.9354 Transcript_8251/m.9354 type:complete len:107 (-) Transcript_8251:14-334(-)